MKAGSGYRSLTVPCRQTLLWLTYGCFTYRKLIRLSKLWILLGESRRTIAGKGHWTNYDRDTHLIHHALRTFLISNLRREKKSARQKIRLYSWTNPNTGDVWKIPVTLLWYQMNRTAYKLTSQSLQFQVSPHSQVTPFENWKEGYPLLRWVERQNLL